LRCPSIPEREIVVANLKRAKRRRSRVAKGEDFEVKHLSETTNLSKSQARLLLRRHGNDWRKLKEVAKELEDKPPTEES
jgi:hypothetical protein